MKKLISLLLFIELISYCCFSQPIIKLKSNVYFIDRGGEISMGEKCSTKVYLYDNFLKLQLNDRLLPISYPLRNLTINVGEKCEIGKYIIYQAVIDDKPLKPIRYITVYFSKIDECEIGMYVIYQAKIVNKPLKPTRYVTIYYSKIDECYYLEIEHFKYSELLKIK